MPSLVGAVIGRWGRELKVQPRSIVPGRQRWDVEVVLGRPCVAEILKAELRESAGVGEVHVNPVTGRLLIFHAVVLSSTDVDQLVRDAVALASRQAMALARSSRRTSTVVSTQGGHRRHVIPSVGFTSGAAIAVGAAVAITLTKGVFLIGSAAVRVGGVLVATVIIVQHVWRRAIRSQQDSTVPLRSTGNRLLKIGLYCPTCGWRRCGMGAEG